jgi:N-methylhydantoinase B
LFYPRPPAPIFLYGWAGDHATEAIHRALFEALPESVPAGSGGDLCGLVLWGKHADGSFWAGGVDHSVGHGATHDGDATSPMMEISGSGIRTTPAEMVESRYPLLVECSELATDSGGAGRHRGGLGVDVNYRVLADTFMTGIFERSTVPGWGLDGGMEGRPNRLAVRAPDGSAHTYTKVTALLLPEGSRVECQTGGGGGYGAREERDPAAIAADIAEGYISEGAASSDYPQLPDLKINEKREIHA